MRLRILEKYRDDLSDGAYSYAYQATKQALERGAIRTEDIAIHFLTIARKYGRITRLSPEQCAAINHS